MNLLTDPWLPIRFRDGHVKTCSIVSIIDETAIEIVLPRADFKGAAYQLLIGVLQTCMAPQDQRVWKQLYHSPPDQDQFQGALANIAHAFNTTGSGPKFMQDFDELEVKTPTPVAALLIDSPGENGIKNNTDFFVKRNRVNAMSWNMANLALFTLQINAPAGGQGIRTGLRGGGPLTTLVMPVTADASLWERLWLNVINRHQWRYSDPDLHSSSVFPWLGPTKVSDKKSEEIYQSDVHELHMYWAMPRRIRMEPREAERLCDISGDHCSSVVLEYKTKNQGNNYSGTWSHPLTPYKWDPKKPTQDHLSLKGQSGGINYKRWDIMTLTHSDDSIGQSAATVVGHFGTICDEFGEQEVPQLWTFGYDMDNMKPRGWYSIELPLFNLSGIDQTELLHSIKELQKLAADMLFYTRSQIKAAWFESPANAKGDMTFIDTVYWQQTESCFFTAVAQLIQQVSSASSYNLDPEQAQVFLRALQTTALGLFDEQAFADLGGHRSMKKKVIARKALNKSVYASKTVRDFRQAMQIVSAAESQATGGTA